LSTPVRFGQPDPGPAVHWLGGWASSLDCWEPQLRALFPDFGHRFIDTHAVLEASPGEAGIAGLPAGDVVAAWSLGSLRAHRWIESGAWPEGLPLLSLCPVFRFVQPGAFGESILLRMEQKLGAEREAVLRDFWRRMPKAADMPPEWEENWIAGTRRYDDAEILRALQYLRLETVDAGALRALPSASLPVGWDLIAGARDRLAPAGEWKDALPAAARLHVYDGGHIPFWECPEQVRDSLHTLSRKSLETSGTP
jgi:pimeloyl-ACP methyl ester carboxylesterase